MSHALFTVLLDVFVLSLLFLCLKHLALLHEEIGQLIASLCRASKIEILLHHFLIVDKEFDGAWNGLNLDEICEPERFTIDLKHSRL